MKGVLLAGGTGSRLRPLTFVTNKHLLPVYDLPMIFYPLQTLLAAGIREIMIVSGKEYAGDIMRLLGSGKEWGAHFTFEVQEEAGGIAQALGLARSFAGSGNLAVILGDNIYEDNFKAAVKSFKSGARIFLKRVPDPERFGVATVKQGKVVKIVEKPKKPVSKNAVTGFYLYDSRVFEIISRLLPSGRGELEITDVNSYYLEQNEIDAVTVKGFWSDAGTFESLHHASELVRRQHRKQAKKK